MMAESSASGNSVLDKENDENSREITLDEFLEEEKQLEDDVLAVLGGSDDKNCTYTMGYIKRQALYACLTCTPASNSNGKPGGVCLACSYSCHEGHDLVELYTKRNFRCDCGNGLYAGKKCSLIPDKAKENKLNVYNQNFAGLYCTCGRPYPDPEGRDPDDEMIQCIICEDWHHGKHLGVPVPSWDFSEMICSSCVSIHNFLAHYAGLSVKNSEETIKTDASNNSETIDVQAVEKPLPVCYILSHESGKPKGALFMPNAWRDKLCRCEKCMATYEREGVKYLLDASDSVQAYEEKGAASGGAKGRYEQGMEALSSLDRVNQIEAIEGYNHLKDELVDFLKKFAENKQVVREEDIREFFSEMQAKKRPRLDLPNFCR